MRVWMWVRTDMEIEMVVWKEMLMILRDPVDGNFCCEYGNPTTIVSGII